MTMRWFLREVAVRADGKEGDMALALLVEDVGPEDASWLATAIVRVQGRDTKAAEDKLAEIGDAHSLSVVVRNADLDIAERFAPILIQKASATVVEECIKQFPRDRADLLKSAKEERYGV